MRYADGPSTTCEIVIAAPPARVWRFVTDIHLPTRLSPELQRVEWLDGATGPAVGARFMGHNQHPRVGQWRTICEITELREQRVFGWVVTAADGRFAGPDGDPTLPVATWRFELEPEAAGTRLRQSVRVGPGRSGLSLAIDRWPDREEELVARRLGELRDNMEAGLRGIRALAEEAEA